MLKKTMLFVVSALVFAGNAFCQEPLFAKKEVKEPLVVIEVGAKVGMTNWVMANTDLFRNGSTKTLLVNSQVNISHQFGEHWALGLVYRGTEGTYRNGSNPLNKSEDYTNLYLHFIGIKADANSGFHIGRLNLMTSFSLGYAHLYRKTNLETRQETTKKLNGIGAGIDVELRQFFGNGLYAGLGLSWQGCRYFGRLNKQQSNKHTMISTFTPMLSLGFGF